MIHSMTAFARSDQKSGAGEISWEVRSVNHRYLDVSLHLPDGLQSLENKFKILIAQKLKRGKLDAKLTFDLTNESDDSILLSQSRIATLLKAHQQLEAQSEQTLALSTMDILQWQGVIRQTPIALEDLFQTAHEGLDVALDDLIKTRKSEGMRLSGFIEQRCNEIRQIVKQVRSRRKQVIAALREKIIKRINDLQIDANTIDNNRLEQELVFHAQRLDVDEELDRLDAHLDEVQDVLKREEAVGRRLDFLMQELNREANTLASKSNDTETTRAAVDLKVLIEQMREQVMNIE